MSELCLMVWTWTALPFNFHIGSWVHEQPITDKMFPDMQFGDETQGVD
jgi:hypothetical protein